MAEAVVSFVVEGVSDLLMEEAQLLHGVSDQVEEVLAKFRWMQAYLQDADARQKEGGVGRWIADLRELVYDAADVLESFILKVASKEREKGMKKILKRYVYALDECVYDYKFGQEIQAIKRRTLELTTRLHKYDIKSRLSAVGESSNSSNEIPSKLKRFYPHVVVDQQVVGLQDDIDTLVAHLTNESDECYPLISICGMAGLGKTTLATKVYNDSKIKSHFDALAWVSISQKWQTREILIRILVSLVPERKTEILNMEDNTKLVKNLLEIQQSKKCLVVLDDIWSNNAWDCLKDGFTTEHSKSKLMLTSRNVKVAEYVNAKGFVHQPQLLENEQSWDLLRMKALPKGDYLDTRYVEQMEKLGREMVGHCAGLPLAVVVLGGILVTKPTLTEWEKVREDMESSLRRGEGIGEQHQREVFDTLVFSYNYLPHQLKPCFLYLGKYGEDVEIKAETLYQLWIAEGIVLSSDRRGEETMMEVAESYLGELVHKCMVQVQHEEGEESSLRKFRSCRLHDLMRDLSLFKAKDEDFFKVVDLRKDSELRKDSDAHYTRRVVIHSEVFDLEKGSKKYFPHNKEASHRIRSVLWFYDEQPIFYGKRPPLFRLRLADFRFLRVLSFEISPYIEFDIIEPNCGLLWFNYKLSQILGNLIHLRYLSLQKTKLIRFPSSIANLEQLQTLDLRGNKFLLTPWMPNNILRKMGRLRHLCLPDCQILGNTKLRFDGLSKLETLENFDSSWCEVKDLSKLINLRKLTLVVIYSLAVMEEIMKYLSSGVSSYLRYTSLSIKGCEYDSGIGHSVLRQLLFSDLHKLNKLRLKGEISSGLPVVDIDNHVMGNVIPSSLTTLILSQSHLEEDPMPVLEKIPTLRSLTLKLFAFKGKELVCSAMGFPQLTNLSLQHLHNLEKWRVDQGSMRNLSFLEIYGCGQLEELPEGLKFLDDLKELRIVDMGEEFSNRVRVVNGEKGADFYKICHVPYVKIYGRRSL